MHGGELGELRDEMQCRMGPSGGPRFYTGPVMGDQSDSSTIKRE